MGMENVFTVTVVSIHISLGKTLNPRLIPIGLVLTYVAEAAHQCMSVSMNW